ncbi:MAG: hypothetical protein K0R09_464 [Clostridiales bacterium]|nr:hypothetical protein [Clostridiales bacterium]
MELWVKAILVFAFIFIGFVVLYFLHKYKKI